jgi:hypothetical protein
MISSTVTSCVPVELNSKFPFSFCSIMEWYKSRMMETEVSKSVTILTRLRTRRLRVRIKTVGDISFHHNAQTCCGSNPASYLMGDATKVKLTTHLYLSPMLGMRGVIYTLPYTSSWPYTQAACTRGKLPSASPLARMRVQTFHASRNSLHSSACHISNASFLAETFA